MAIPIFDRELNTFCNKYMFSNRPVSAVDQAAFPIQSRALHQNMFEQFLLFDTVAFKVSGENVPLALLVSQFGLKGLEQLVEEGALKFVLWTNDVMRMKSDIPGIDPLVTSKMSSPAHSDPEASIELGLNWLTNKIPPSRLKRLTAKIAPLYEPQPENLTTDVAALAQSAYLTGRLSKYGLSPHDAPIRELPDAKKAILLDCAVELLEYKLLVAKNWSSLSSYAYFDLFSESVRRLTAASSVTTGFRQLAEIEHMPNLSPLFETISAPLRAVPKLRSRRSSVKFRKWLAAGGDETPLELTKRYVDSIADSKGYFDRAPGKFVKSIGMTAAGAGLGALITDGLEGAAAGALAAKIVEPLADLGLDLLDSFLIENLARGWTPKVFFSQINKKFSTPLNLQS